MAHSVLSRKRLVVAVVTVAVLASLASCITLVRSDERAIVRRFGRILPEKPGPGLHIGLPWGMDRVDRVSVKDRTVTVGWVTSEPDENAPLIPGQFLTGDHNLVNVQAVVSYRVIVNEADGYRELADYVLQQDQAEPLIARATEAGLAQWLAGHDVQDAILHGKFLLPGWLKEHVQQRIAPYQLGVRVDGASIVLIEPPTEVKPYFDAVGQEHTRMDTLKNQALTRAASEAMKAEAAGKRLASQARAYLSEQKLAAQADAQSFAKKLEQYRKLNLQNGDYLYYYWLEEITRVYAQVRQNGRLDVVDDYLGSDGINITQFPLPQRKK